MHHNVKFVMVSSTVGDLADYRDGVLKACMRLHMFPEMMENLLAEGVTAIKASLQLVDKVDIYLGIFAHRYGYIPPGHDISITEMEYNRAVERDIPRLIFLIDESHPVKPADMDTGKSRRKLKAFKKRLQTENIVNFFTTPDNLRANVVNSLSQYHTSCNEKETTDSPLVNDIPTPPEPYIAHPYLLLQTSSLVGRRDELNMLTDWATKPGSTFYPFRILNLVALGGMGKSALTWEWFNEVAPHVMKSLAGRLWWSFYEPEATFDNFIINALAYVTKQDKEDVKNIKPSDRETQLLAYLSRKPCLLVLDGLERILIAYKRVDADLFADDEMGQKTANAAAGKLGLPESAAQSFTGQRQLRKTDSPHVGKFLLKLARVRASRILVSTRLYPADLQTVTDGFMPGSAAYFMGGLSDADALKLWQTFGISGSADELLRLFHTFDNHPLLIQALAGEIARYKPAPRDFDRWRKDNPDFDPFSLPLVQVKSHVLSFAMRGLSALEKKVLHIITAFRMPTSYDMLAAVLINKGKVAHRELDAVLTELEDRGLLGWNKQANRYDLHPVVRGVVWNGLKGENKVGNDGDSRMNFESIQFKRFDELKPAIELYNELVSLNLYDEAAQLFYDRLNEITLYHYAAPRLRAELLEKLFPDGIDQPPRLQTADDQAFILNALAATYLTGGQPQKAAGLYRRQTAIDKETGAGENFSIGLGNLANSLRQSGKLRAAEAAACHSLSLARDDKNHFLEAVDLGWLGMSLAVRGKLVEGEKALRRVLRIFDKRRQAPIEIADERHDASADATARAFLARLMLWKGEPMAARQLINEAWKLANDEHHERYVILVRRMQGAVALALHDYSAAEKDLTQALTDARSVNVVVEEVLALIELAELNWKQGKEKAARKLLDEVWSPAESGPYPMFHAEAYNLLAEIESASGNHAKAIEAAAKAYLFAWCDAPPFAYHWGLEKARKNLKELGAPEPPMPPFDKSSFEAMPEVEINPPDEFGGQES